MSTEKLIEGPFPKRVVLVEEPDSTNKGRVTVGFTYTATELAGSCLVVIADDGEPAMIWRGRFKAVE